MNQPTLLRFPFFDSSAQTARLEVSDSRENEELLLFDEDNCFKWIFVEEGEGAIEIGKNQIETKSGDLFLIAPQENYNFNELKPTKYWVVLYQYETGRVTCSDNCHALFVLLLDKFRLASFFYSNSMKTKRFQLQPLERSRWLNRLQQMKHELHEQSLGFVEMLNTLVAQLLMDTVRLMTATDSQKPTLSHPLMLSVFRAIEENYHQTKFSLSDVAKIINFSPAYLTDLVRRKTGRTVVSWICEYRMTAARRLLETTTQSVSQIALTVGYEDTAYFIRQFRRLHGVTPKAWRDKHKAVLFA